MDALSIASRSNQGEASVLSRGNQEDFGKMIIGERMRQLKEEKAREGDVKALLGDEVKAEWAADNINYFQPKIEELKKKTIDMYRQKNGKLSDIDMFELKQNWAKLKSEAEVSNALYAEEEDRKNMLQADSNFEKFDEESWNLRKIWNNPHEMFAEDIKKEGGIIPWRAKNSEAFNNIGAYSLEEHLGKTLKDKNSKWFLRDEAGKVKSYTDPKTGLVVSEYREGVDPEKLSEHIGTIWNDPKDWKSKRMRGLATKWVDTNFKVYDDGTIAPQSEEAIEVFKNAPNLKGMKPEQIRSVLGKQYVIEEAKVRFPAKEGIMTEKPININTGNGGGGGFTPDSFNWATGMQGPGITLNDKIVKTLTGGVDELNYQKAKEAAEKYRKENAGKYSGFPYVSMTFKDGKDNPKLTYQGEEYISNGFVRKGGKWYMVGSQPVKRELSDKEKKKLAREGRLSADNMFITEEVPVTADVAVKHGFEGRNAIPNMINFLNSKTPQDF